MLSCFVLHKYWNRDLDFIVFVALFTFDVSGLYQRFESKLGYRTLLNKPLSTTWRHEYWWADVLSNKYILNVKRGEVHRTQRKPSLPPIRSKMAQSGDDLGNIHSPLYWHTSSISLTHTKPVRFCLFPSPYTSDIAQGERIIYDSGLLCSARGCHISLNVRQPHSSAAQPQKRVKNKPVGTRRARRRICKLMVCVAIK